MKKIAILAAALCLVATASSADSGVRRVPCGYQQITVLSAATNLVVPACGNGPTMAVITAEAQDVRYRDDGVAPTGTVGQPLAQGQPLVYEGTLSAIQFIEQTSGAKLNVSFYR